MGVYCKVVPGSKRDDLGGGDEGDEDSDEDQPKRLVVYFNFEKVGKKVTITDKSGYENSGTMTQGGEILRYSDKDYTCNQGARLWDSEILLRGDTFQAKPKIAITVAAWIKLEEQKGQHSVFDTVGTSHPQGQYHFEVNNGIVRWFHRNEKQVVIFESMAHTVEKEKWTHIAGTYDSKTKQAKIFINGEIRNQSIGDGQLSRDWGMRAGISNRDKGRLLRGSVDEFRIYNYALTPDEIKALVSACMSTPPAGAGKPDAPVDTAPATIETSDNNGVPGNVRSIDTGKDGKDVRENENNQTTNRRKRRSLELTRKLFY